MKREILYEKTYPRIIIREEDIEAAAKAECELDMCFGLHVIFIF